MNDFTMGRDDVLRLLNELSERLGARGIRGELFIVGGAAMALAYDGSRTTSDIGSLIKPRDEVLDEAARMALEHDLPADWLNDSVARLMPPHPDDNPVAVADLPGLTVRAGSPEFMLAMKSMVIRKSPPDLEDAAIICASLGIKDWYKIEEVIRRYIGPGSLGSRELWLEDIADRAAQIAARAEAF